jgi:hypothetical protein
MACKPSRRNRRANVDVPLDLVRFTEKLLRALRWDGEFNPSAGFKPSAFEGGSNTPDRFGVNYLVSELFSKYDDGEPSPEKEARTWERFSLAEEACLSANQRILYDKSRFGISNRSVESLLAAAQRKICRILGPFDWNQAAHGFAFGPGATTRLPRRRSDAAYKYSGPPETTSGNLALATAAITAVPLWKESLISEEGPLDIRVVKGNKVVTVPKNWKTDRVIAIEPDMNMYVQKGIGKMIRRRLKQHGVDLDDQTRNQELARKGVALGLATVDLSMASDTVSYELVRHLMPPDWFEALEQCRSPIGVLPSGQEILYRKFSSMGNGYTFELESLLFYALALAVSDAYRLEACNVTVYGDDIIFPASGFGPCDLLSYCGFTVNDSKSFADGPFRESCGKHYYHGRDVTPFYIKRPPSTLRELFLLHNQIYRWCSRNRDNWVWHRGEMRSLLQWLKGICPRAWRKRYIPDGFGDGAFIGTFDEACPRPAPRGWEGWQCVVLADVSQHGELDTTGRFIKSLHKLENRSSVLWYDECIGGVALPPRVRQLKVVVPRFSGEDPFLILLPRIS